jgi:plasmid maintenance system antidote protein VapI
VLAKRQILGDEARPRAEGREERTDDPSTSASIPATIAEPGPLVSGESEPRMRYARPPLRWPPTPATASETSISPGQDAGAFLEHLNGGSLTFAQMLHSIRRGDELSLSAFAKKLGVSVQHLCDIEKGRRGVSVERAARWARLLGYPQWQLVELAMQAELDAAGIKLKVGVKAA